MTQFQETIYNSLPLGLVVLDSLRLALCAPGGQYKLPDNEKPRQAVNDSHGERTKGCHKK